MHAALIACAALALALCLDWLLGEPPAWAHPVVGMGCYLGWAGDRFAPSCGQRQPHWPAFAWGALAWCVGAAAVVSFAGWLQAQLLPLDAWIAAGLMALALKPLLAWRALHHEVAAVEQALGQSLAAGRVQLARLVSRDVTQLSETEVREAAIESLAENLNDSLVAPVFWFVVAGLPGAALYRFANTADAMWGYPGQRGAHHWHWAGKFAARADDVLSWVPARITAALLALVAGGLNARALAQQAAQTPSPNSGWPMAAMAMALNVALNKPGVYTLNDHGMAATQQHMANALNLASKATLALVLTAQAAIYLIACIAVVRGATP